MIDITRIISIESSGKADAVSDKGAVGLMGVRKTALDDWNNDHPRERYTMDDLLDEDTNVRVGSWYMNIKIPAMMSLMKIEDTEENRITAYNAGIGNLQKILAGEKEIPKETQDYIIKYKMGGDIKAAQERLLEMGFDPGPIDGIYGPKTKKAFMDFQNSDKHAPMVKKQFGIMNLKESADAIR